MNRQFLRVLVFVLCALGQVFASAFAQDIDSNARGLGAAKQLVQSKSRQDELEVSPEQLAAIIRLLESKEVLEAAEKNIFQSMGIEIDSDSLGDFGGTGQLNANEVLVDDLVAEKLATILYPAQFDKMRIDNVRGQVGFPLDVFQRTRLVQLGIPTNAVAQIVQNVADKSANSLGKVRDLRTKAVSTFLADFPEKSKEKFASFFGREYLPDSVTGGMHESSIGICREDRGDALFLSLHGAVFKEEIEPLSHQQLGEIAKVNAELTRKRSDPQFDFENEGYSAAVKNLTSSQRLAAAHQVHLKLLESDLKVIVRPDIARFLELPGELLPAIRLECEKMQADLDARRLESELEVFKQVYSDLQTGFRGRIRRLYNNVWCELN